MMVKLPLLLNSAGLFSQSIFEYIHVYAAFRNSSTVPSKEAKNKNKHDFSLCPRLRLIEVESDLLLGILSFWQLVLANSRQVLGERLNVSFTERWKRYIRCHIRTVEV